MMTKDLIDAALELDVEKLGTETALLEATQADAQKGTDRDVAHKAAHDDLASNGQALYVSDDLPPTYAIAGPAEPDTFTLTPIRVA